MVNLVTSDKKKSFSELFEQEDNLLYNSNMLNLVSAVKNINNELEQMQKRRIELIAAKAEIEKYAEKGDILDTSEVSRLFDLGRDMQYKKKNW